MDDTIYLVTGAPGSGKSTVLDHFLRLKSGYVALDIDWLTVSASHLAGRDVIFDVAVGKQFRLLWFDFLRCICRSNQVPILFSPLDPRQTADLGQPDWHPGIEWLLLDCSDDVRQERLCQRSDWTSQMIDEAAKDASHLRHAIARQIDTGARSPEEAAKMILDWVNRLRAPDRNRTSGRLR